MPAEAFEPHSDALQIRCPQCSQRFTVGGNLHGRMVECGACENQFRVDETTIVHQRKFYPGEKRDPLLEHLSRTPHEVPPAQTTSVEYAEPPAHAIEPGSPQRALAGLVGVAIMAWGAASLANGGSNSGLLAGVSDDRRLMFAVFVAFISSILWVYANRRRRMLAMILAMVSTTGLLALPFVFHGQPKPLERRESNTASRPNESSDIAPQPALLKQIDPLKDELAKSKSANRSGNTLGIWFDGLEESHKLQVRDYILRTTGADLSSHLYPRESADYLMVLIGSKADLDQLAQLSERIGKVVKKFPEYALIEVDVDNLLFVARDTNQLNDLSSREFYVINKQELESIDLQRARQAVRRLASAEPKLLRADILKLLLQLLDQVDPEFQGDICRALMVWSAGEAQTVQRVADALKKLSGKLENVPSEMIAFLAKNHEPSSLKVAHRLWLQDATEWEGLYAEYGPMAEPLLIEELPKLDDVMLQFSAVRILHRIGTPASLEVLERVRAKANPELRASLERTMTSIRERSKK